MSIKQYDHKRNSLDKFEFESHGPKGVITKAVSYRKTKRSIRGAPIFTLGFGDYNETDHTINDTVTSDNKDKMMVLGTVASTVIKFSNDFEKVAVHAVGSTPSRTRLYQMGINAHKEEIEEHFSIMGHRDDDWEEFKPGVNYDEFLVIKKN